MTTRPCLLLLLVAACGGPPFTGSNALERVETVQVDSTYPVDAGAELVDVHQVEKEAAPPATCDLRACECGTSHVALCCEGPCPHGFEGMTCYCGDCRFPTTYDAGRCF